MLRYGLLCCLLISFLGDLVEPQSSGEGCYTPEQTIGRCVDIRQCDPLLQLLQGPRPLPASAVDYLRRAQCGFQGRTPLVCCSASSVPTQINLLGKLPVLEPSRMCMTFQSSPVTAPSPQSAPVDVSNHSALRLMPDYCGPIAESKITGGNETELFEYPWMALLGYVTRDSDEVQYRCGGSLINSRYVLTAAHCVLFLNNLELVEVRLGEHDLRTEEDCSGEMGCAPPAVDFRVEKVIPHPQYNKDELRNDIALVRLRRTVRFSQAIRPICLPIGAEQGRNLEREKVTVTGWGATEYGTGSLVLLKVDLPVVPLAKCAAIYNRSVPVTERQLCAGGINGKDSCGGDSGGPLQFVGQAEQGGLSYIQYGIVSFGPRQCGTTGRPGVYTRVGHYMDWILNNLRP